MRKQSSCVVIGLAISLALGSAVWAESDSTQTMAAPFELQDLDGKVQRLNDYLQSGPVFLWFTNFCGGCQSAIPQIKEAFTEAKRPLLIVSLLSDDRKTPRQIRKKMEMTFPILLDPDGNVTKQYSGAYIPKTCPVENFYAISPDGSIAYSGHYPGLDSDDLKALLYKLK